MAFVATIVAPAPVVVPKSKSVSRLPLLGYANNSTLFLHLLAYVYSDMVPWYLPCSGS